MKEKKEIAAVSAVLAYVKEETDTVSAIAMQRTRSQQQSRRSIQARMNIWGVAGRQAQMQLRNLMQVKAFHGLNNRA
ncbi:MAG: hypothetical protein P8Y38_11045 [Deltaproteobacteria bacterium]|jgi:hypothetical protein